MNPTHTLLTVKEAADLLRVSRETIRRRIGTKELRAIRVGPRSTRVSAADVQALLQPVV